MTDYERLKRQMLDETPDGGSSTTSHTDIDQSDSRSQRSPKLQMFLCLALVVAGAGGYALWNFQPPDSMNLPKMVGSWMDSMKTGKRWEKRIRSYREYDDPMIDVPEIGY